MSLVVVERTFPQPVDFGDVQATEERKAWCLEAHAVSFVKSYFSSDRQRMVCFYEGPDAESVRRVQELAGLPFDRVWSARVVGHAPEEPRGQAVLVERTFDPPRDEAALRDAAAQGGGCLELHGCRIAWSYLSPDGRRAICVFGAPDAESVRLAQRQGNLPSDRTWPASVHWPSRP